METPALHAAVVKNDVALVKKLLAEDGGSSAVNVSVKGDFPLHLAAKGRSVAITELLLAAGANPNQGFELSGSMKGYTAAHFAARNDDIDIINVLKKHKADLNRSAEDGWTPLHCAAFSGKKQALQTLIRCGAEIDHKTNQGHTALTFCCNHGRASHVRELLAQHADVNMKDTGGDTLLHHALHYRMSKLFEGEYDIPEVQLDVVVLLALAGIAVDEKNIESETAFKFIEEDLPSLENVLKIIKAGSGRLCKSSIEWNYMTFVSIRIDQLLALGLEPKLAADLVDNIKKLDEERIDEKQRREASKPSGGCPVMTGKKKKRGEAPTAAPSPDMPSNNTTQSPTKTEGAAVPPVHNPHPDVDVRNVDPNGPDPSGGKCPFFKRPGAPPVGAAVLSKKDSSPPPPNTAGVAAASAAKVLPPQPPAVPPAIPGPNAGILAQITDNKAHVLHIALAFFVGIWFEQMMMRVFGR